MNCFLVIAPTDSRVQPLVAKEFPRNYTVIPDRVWVVAGSQATCSEVSKALEVEEGNPAVVTKLGEYYGYFDRALWQNIEQWRVLQ